MTNVSKLNTLLNSANILETLVKSVLLCDLMIVFARFPKYLLSLIKYSALKVPHLCLTLPVQGGGGGASRPPKVFLR